MDNIYVLNRDNRALVAELEEGVETIYGKSISQSERNVVENLEMHRTDCGILTMFKYSKEYDREEIMEHFIDFTTGNIPDNTSNPQDASYKDVFTWIKTIDGTDLDISLKILFGLDMFQSFVCFSAEQRRLFLAETQVHYWVFDLDI